MLIGMVVDLTPTPRVVIVPLILMTSAAPTNQKMADIRRVGTNLLIQLVRPLKRGSLRSISLHRRKELRKKAMTGHAGRMRLARQGSIVKIHHDLTVGQNENPSHSDHLIIEISGTRHPTTPVRTIHGGGDNMKNPGAGGSRSSGMAGPTI